MPDPMEALRQSVERLKKVQEAAKKASEKPAAPPATSGSQPSSG